MDTMPKKRGDRFLLYAGHIIAWGILFAFPLALRWQSSAGITLGWYLGYAFTPLSFLVVFYANYCLLIPRLMFQKRWGLFIALNVMLILVLWYAGHLWRSFHMEMFGDLREGPPKEGFIPPILFMARDFMLNLLTVALAVAIKMTSRWQQSENQRNEAERRRSEAELSNLKNQLNPHFLFNTLNNIYALIEVDSAKAQNAVHELSRLLRYVLYEGGPAVVPLEKELDFLRNYIALMSLRTGSHVSQHISLESDDPSAVTAPLIFISLVENAFKHGVSPSEKSFIEITIKTEGGRIVCRTVNSNFPKTDSDRSGSGIGIQNLERRLKLIYGSDYTFSRGVADGTYRCELSLPSNPRAR